MYAVISSIKIMREIIYFEIFMDWCAILAIYSYNIYNCYHSTHIVYVAKLRLNHISSILFHYIAQTLYGVISKRRFGKIALIPEHLKNLSFL